MRTVFLIHPWLKLLKNNFAARLALAFLFSAWLLAPAKSLATASAPTNDNFVNAQIITGTHGSVVGTNVNATTQNGVNGETWIYWATVWYRWTAPANGRYTMTTLGSTFNTNMYAASGATLAGLTQLAYCGATVLSASASGPVTSTITFDANAGSTYYICIGGDQATDEGSLTLNWTLLQLRAANDNFANAQAISGASGVATGQNIGATIESGETWIYNHSIWYRWTAPINGRYTMNTLGSTFNTNMYAASGVTLAGLTQLASCGATVLSATASGPATSTITFDADAGVAYYICVGGDTDPDEGEATLNWTLVQARAANDNFVNAQPIGGASGNLTSQNIGTGTESGETWIYCHTVWYLWTAPANGVYTFNTKGSAFNTNLDVTSGVSLAGLDQITYDGASVAATSATMGATSSVTFSATGGLQYYIRVGGDSDTDEGFFNLNWSRQEVSTVQFSASSYKVDEFAGLAWITVLRTTGTNNFTTVQVTTSKTRGNAKPGVNYSNTVRTLNFVPGQAFATFSVPIREDRIFYPKPLYFKVSLINPGPITALGNPHEATVFIMDDDGPGGSIGFAPASYSTPASAGTVPVTIRRSGSTAKKVTVRLSTQNGSAVAPSDYLVRRNYLVTIPAGKRSAVVRIPIVNDPAPDDAEFFYLQLTSPTGGGILGAQTSATVTIQAH